MNSYNTVNAAFRAAGKKPSEGVSHGRDWFEVEDFRLSLRAHGREAAAAGNTDDPFHWENRREGAFNPIMERDFQKMVTHAAAYGGTVTRAAYSAKVRESQEQGVCDMGVGCEEYGVCYAAAHDAPERCGMPPSPGTEQVRLPYSRDVAALQELGTRLLGAGGIAAARAGAQVGG